MLFGRTKRLFVVKMFAIALMSMTTLVDVASAIEKEHDLVAVVLGEEIYASDLEPTAEEIASRGPIADEYAMQQWLKYSQGMHISNKIIKPIFDDYAEKAGLKATKSEVDEVIEFWVLAGQRKPEDPISERAIRRAEEMVREWKLKKLLHQKYGGRSVAGMIDFSPVDAIRTYVYEQERKGNLKIIDDKIRTLLHFTLSPEEHAFFQDRFYDEAESSKHYESPYWRKMLEGRKNRDLDKQ